MAGRTVKTAEAVSGTGKRGVAERNVAAGKREEVVRKGVAAGTGETVRDVALVFPSPRERKITDKNRQQWRIYESWNGI